MSKLYKDHNYVIVSIFEFRHLANEFALFINDDDFSTFTKHDYALMLMIRPIKNEVINKSLDVIIIILYKATCVYRKARNINTDIVK